MIKIEAVSKSFNGTEALSGLEMEVNKGEIYGLLGPNGAGKSTTINLLLGFIKPDAGEVTVNDISPTANPGQARKICGYIPENVNLYEHLTGIENLQYFSNLAGLKKTIPEMAEILKECGLEPEAHHKRVGKYSKGMRQKVGIAIAFAKNAAVYLLDEPASGLDPAASNELTKILQKLSGNGASILMASHDIFRVRETCHKIGILKNGTLIREMDADSLSSNELEHLYLEYMHQ